MTTPQITITKIDHDSWWGYYINDTLYGYNDYYNFSDSEVKKEAVLQAIDEGLIKKRSDPLEIVFEHHTDWPEFAANTDLAEVVVQQFDNELPATLTAFKAWIAEHANDKYERSW